MTNHLANTRIPLKVRLTASNAALAYANAKIEGNARDIMLAHADFLNAVNDVRICIKAITLGMDNDD